MEANDTEGKELHDWDAIKSQPSLAHSESKATDRLYESDVDEEDMVEDSNFWKELTKSKHDSLKGDLHAKNKKSEIPLLNNSKDIQNEIKDFNNQHSEIRHPMAHLKADLNSNKLILISRLLWYGFRPRWRLSDSGKEAQVTMKSPREHKS